MRRPVQIQGRGGAAAGSVNNRAQYLRPALDNQNSRMLARAFSQMNRSFGRIASNETRLQNRQMADELQELETYQEEQKQIAIQMGAQAALTGDEFLDTFWNNPVNVQYYNESRAAGLEDLNLVQTVAEFEASPAFGNPDDPTAATAFWSSYTADRVSNTPVELQPDVLARIAPQATQSIQRSQIAAAKVALQNETDALSSHVDLAFLGSGTWQEMTGRLNTLRNEKSAARGPAIGNQMSTDALVYSLQVLVDRNSIERSEQVISMMREAIDFSDEQGKNPWWDDYSINERLQIMNALGVAETTLRSAQAQETARLDAQREAQVMGLYMRSLDADPSNHPTVTDYANALGPIEGIKTMKEHRAILVDRNDLDFLNDTEENRISSAIETQGAMLTMTEQQFTAAERTTFLSELAAATTRSDFDKLVAFFPEVPDAFDDPTISMAMRNASAFTDLLGDFVEGDDTSLFIDSVGGDGFSTSVKTREFKAALNIYIQDRASDWQEALRKGTTEEFVDKAVSHAVNVVMTNPLPDGTVLNDVLMKKANELEFTAIYSANPVFQQYLAGSGVASQMDAFAALYEEGLAAAYDGTVNKVANMIERYTADPDGDGISIFRGNTQSMTQDLNEDGVIDAREQMFAADEDEAGPQSTITRESLGITDIDRERQSDGGSVPASIRTFNWGAIGEVTNKDAAANFEKAFADRTLDSVDLPALDGRDYATPVFKTAEDGLRYFGWWLAYRGNPTTIAELGDEYYPNNEMDRDDWVTGVSQLASMDADDNITSDNLNAVAFGVFSQEAGPGAFTATKLSTSVDMAKFIMEGSQMYHDNK